MWTFTAEASRQYQGRYRALLRGYVSSGTTGDVQVRLCLGYQGPITSVTYWRSEIADAPASGISWIDLGVIELWGMPFGRGQTGSGYYSGIIIEAACNVAAARNLYLYDLFLLPYDEWAADWSQPRMGWTMAIMNSLSGQIDSLTTPLESKGYLAYGAEDRFFLPSVLVTTGPAILPARKRLRLHWAFNETVPSGYAYQMLNAVKVQHNARYSGFRGRR